MTIEIKPVKGVTLLVTGKLIKAEPEVGLPASFEIKEITSPEKDLSELIEWASAQGNGVLEGIEKTCIEQIYTE